MALKLLLAFGALATCSSVLRQGIAAAPTPALNLVDGLLGAHAQNESSGVGTAGGRAREGASWAPEEARRGRRDAQDVRDSGASLSGRSRHLEPLFVEEPRWILLERRELPAQASGPSAGDLGFSVVGMPAQGVEPFWVARGRRRDGMSIASSEDPFWASRGRRLAPQLRSVLRRDSTSGEEPFWAARGRRAPTDGTTDAEAAEAAKTASSAGPRWRRRQAESVEEPFWAARGRRRAHSRGDSLSLEEPFWAARGKKGAQAFQDLLSKVRPRGASPDLDPFWAARGKRNGVTGEDAEENADDNRFWTTLEERSSLSGF